MSRTFIAHTAIIVAAPFAVLRGGIGWATDGLATILGSHQPFPAREGLIAALTQFFFSQPASSQPMTVKPLPPATIASATVTTIHPSSCTGSYTVQAADDCNPFALAHNVSTYSLLYGNNLDIYCQNFAAAVNPSLCIPPQCKTWTWKALDSCNSVASTVGVTVPQFLLWNPNFNSLCQNSLNFVGYQICIR